MPVQIGALSEDSDIDVLILLPKDTSYLFSIPRVKPAIEYILDRIRGNESLHSGFTFKARYENSNCGNQALFTLVELSFKRKPDVILGPVCEYAAAPVIRLASHWNIPVISAGALASGFASKSPEYTHLTRVSPSYRKMGETFKAMFRFFDWKRALFIYDDDNMERNCYFATEGVYGALDEDGRHTVTHKIDSRYHVDVDEIIKLIQDSASGLQIHLSGSQGVINHSYHNVVKKVCNGSNFCKKWPLYQKVRWNGSWKRGDKYDAEAKQAYASLKTVTLLRSVKPEFENFSTEVRKSLQKLKLDDEDNSVRIAGQVSIDSNGDRNGDFSVIGMTDPEAGTHEVLANYYGLNESFELQPRAKTGHFFQRLPSVEIYPGESAIPCKSCNLFLLMVIRELRYFVLKNYRITIERRIQREECNIGKHRQLREDSIRSNFSTA
ncbi:ANPRC protein, partial [Polypterus senegalus]|nr:ANPRC protein [Polypterus senegalus]